MENKLDSMRFDIIDGGNELKAEAPLLPAVVTQIPTDGQEEPTQRRLKNLIAIIVKAVKEYNATPTQVRYVFAEVKKQSGLVLAFKPRALPEFMNPAEIYTFLEQAGNINPTRRLMCEILIFTGMRINELRNLDIRDINFSNNQILIRVAKGGKQRYVPVTNSLLHKIKLFMGERTTGYLFLNSNNAQFIKRSLQKYITEVYKRCGFSKKLHTHSTRHTFATMCMAKGMTLEQVQVLMGHSSRLTTEIYARLELGDVKDKYLQLMGDN